MNYKLITVLLIAVFANVMRAEEVTYINQTFDKKNFYKPGKITNSGHPKIKMGAFTGRNYAEFTIVTSPVKSKPYALKISRIKNYRETNIFRDQALPAKHNFTISFWGYAENKLCKFGFAALDGRKNKTGKLIPGSGVSIDNMNHFRIFAPTIEKANMWDKWMKTQFAVPRKKWFRCVLKYDLARKLYRLELSTEDGKIGTSEWVSLVNAMPPKSFRFMNSWPTGNSIVIDDFKVTYDKALATKDSLLENHALSASVNDKKFEAVKDNNYNTGIKIKPGADLEMVLGSTVLVDRIQIASGDSNGKESFKDCSISAENTSGHNLQLAKNKHNNGKYIEYTFSPERLSKVDFKFQAVAPGKEVFLREIRIFSPEKRMDMVEKLKFMKKVYGEFRLPVYEDQKTACLTLCNISKKPYKIGLTLTERFSGKAIEPLKIISLKPGCNEINFPISELPDGSYVATIEDYANPKARHKTKLLRSLRIQHSKPFKKAALYNMSGKVMYFPDDHYFAKYNNLKFTAPQGKVIEAVAAKRGYNQLGKRIYFDKDGKLNVIFESYKRGNSKDKKFFLATATDADLHKWTVIPFKGSLSLGQGTKIWEKRNPAAVKPDWYPRRINGKSIKLRFYDPSKDGKVKLSQVRIWYHMRGSTGVKQRKNAVLDWSEINPLRGSVWPIWFKAPGVGLVLTKESLLQDMPGETAELENPKASHDNMGGQILSDDGKTISYFHANILRRFPPYNAPWDNLLRYSRIMTAFYTHDGIHFKSRRMLLPDLNDPIASQHYGLLTRRPKDSNGLYLCYMMRYKAYTQQIDLITGYSWDAINWKKIPGPPFAANGPHGSFNSGTIWIPFRIVERNGKAYGVFFFNVLGLYHFFGEIMELPYSLTENVNWMKKRFEPRQLAESPLFKKFGSWEKLANYRKDFNVGAAIAVIVFRKDGFFCIEAGNKEGGFTSLPLTTADPLRINAEIKKNGYIKIELADADSKLIPEYSGKNAVILKEGGYMDKILSFGAKQALPQGEFRIIATMRNAQLFTFNFTNE